MMMNTNSNVKGFTLIELLIVIAILGILAAAVVVVINPAQLLAEARDTQRIEDTAAVHSAMSLYASTAASPDFTTGGPFSTVQTDCSDVAGATACVVRAIYTTANAGWVDVNLGNTSGGSPLATLPRDPSSTGELQYVYFGNDTSDTWEIGATMESTKYANGGSGDVETKDGGNAANALERGNEPGLDLMTGT